MPPPSEQEYSLTFGHTRQRFASPPAVPRPEIPATRLIRSMSIHVRLCASLCPYNNVDTEVTCWLTNLPLCMGWISYSNGEPLRRPCSEVSFH
jgi:hypothetical protein